MRLLLAALLLAAAPAGAVAQSKLELDYLQTSPAKAVAYSAIIPGGGYFHLSKVSPRYENSAYLFLILGLASYGLLGDQLSKHNGMGIAAAGAAVVAVKLIEFGAVTDAAERERFRLFHKE